MYCTYTLDTKHPGNPRIILGCPLCAGDTPWIPFNCYQQEYPTHPYCVQIPERRLHLSALLTAEKVRRHGNKGAALTAMQELEAAGLGKLESTESRKGTSGVGSLKIAS